MLFISQGFLKKWFLISTLFKLWGINKCHSFCFQSFLMTPFINPGDQSERRYSNALCRTRVLIEQTLGFLKKRFQCLNLLRTKPELAVVYIKALPLLCTTLVLKGEKFVKHSSMLCSMLLMLTLVLLEVMAMPRGRILCKHLSAR